MYSIERILKLNYKALRVCVYCLYYYAPYALHVLYLSLIHIEFSYLEGSFVLDWEWPIVYTETSGVLQMSSHKGQIKEDKAHGAAWSFSCDLEHMRTMVSPCPTPVSN